MLDTNILMNLVRGNEQGKQAKSWVDSLTDPLLIISVVSVAEAQSLVVKWNWGTKKVEKLTALINQLICIDIEMENQLLVEHYVNIDAYSNRKQAAPNGELLEGSAQRMGKNDLWIAATAHTLEATLCTTDGDFDHLHTSFFTVKKF